MINLFEIGVGLITQLPSTLDITKNFRDFFSSVLANMTAVALPLLASTEEGNISLPSDINFQSFNPLSRISHLEKISNSSAKGTCSRACWAAFPCSRTEKET
jgi:hypothetical protein